MIGKIFPWFLSFKNIAEFHELGIHYTLLSYELDISATKSLKKDCRAVPTCVFSRWLWWNVVDHIVSTHGSVFSSGCFFSFLSFFLHLFIFERQSVSGGETERERETQNLKQAPGSGLSAHSPTWGLEPVNREIVTWAEVGRSTDWATQAPSSGCFFSAVITCCFRSIDRISVRQDLLDLCCASLGFSSVSLLPCCSLQLYLGELPCLHILPIWLSMVLILLPSFSVNFKSNADSLSS